MEKCGFNTAISEIKDACTDADNEISPYFFIVGAGVSAPQIKTASSIIDDCKVKAAGRGIGIEAIVNDGKDAYSHWFKVAYPNPSQRQRYLRKLMEGQPISHANFRLAHLLLPLQTESNARIKRHFNLVVTPNFDDMLSRALVLFGEAPIVCDHPATVERLYSTWDDETDVKIVHVHGTYWFYDCCNLDTELAGRAASETIVSMRAILNHILAERVPLVVGYSGWENDVIMTTLKEVLSARHQLPYNIYWFCYRREDADKLPEWLKDHISVRIVLPDSADAKPISTQETNRGTERASASKPVHALSIGQNESEKTISATQVFEALIRSFDLDEPELTKEPTHYLIKHLKKNLPLGTDEGDLYAFSSVISRLELADASSLPITPIDDIRSAIRRADLDTAIRKASSIDLDTSKFEDISELFDDLWSIHTTIQNDSDQALNFYSLTAKLCDYLGHHGKHKDKEYVASLFNRGIFLKDLGKSEEAIAAYDQVITRFGDRNEPEIAEQVARAFFNKGYRLGELGKNEEEIAAYNQVLARFGDRNEPGIAKQVAMAFVNKGCRLGELGKNEEAIAAYDQVLTRFGDRNEPEIAEQVAKAFFNKGITLKDLGKNEEAIAAYDQVLARFGDRIEPEIAEQVAKGRRLKGKGPAQKNKTDDLLE